MAKKAVDSDVLMLPGRRKTKTVVSKSRKQVVIRKSKKNTKKIEKKASFSSDEEKDSGILGFMGMSEKGDLEIKVMCGNCMKWSIAIKLNIAVNVDKEVSLLWYCYKCRRYNDITFGTVVTRT